MVAIFAFGAIAAALINSIQRFESVRNCLVAETLGVALQFSEPTQHQRF
jgi:hypothetical protein